MMSSHSPYDVGAVELHVSLNDQDYTDEGPFHVYYGAPTLQSFSPTSGPADGGTLISLFGAELAGGTHYTCRFGNAAYPQDPYHAFNAHPTDRFGHYARLDAMVAGCAEDPIDSSASAVAARQACARLPGGE
eukprot:2125258-Prymnesium_polylepis.1